MLDILWIHFGRFGLISSQAHHFLEPLEHILGSKSQLLSAKKIEIMIDIIFAFWETPPTENSKKPWGFANVHKKIRPYLGSKKQ